MLNSLSFLKEFVVPLTIKNLSLIPLFALVFFLLGVLGLQLQSSQTGVSPIWPASGWTLACLLLYGFRLWPGVLLGMICVGIYVSLPLWIGVVSGLGAILESVIPLIIARRFGFTGRLDTLYEAFIFSAIVTFGPLISAGTGGLALYIAAGGESMPSQAIVMHWWLGNSVGMLLFGGVILALNEGIEKGVFFRLFWEKTAILLGAFIICMMAISRSKGIESALFINLIIPLTLYGAIRFGAFGALVPGLLILLMFLFIAGNLPQSFFEHAPFGYLYLILVEIWFVGISGVLMAGAFRDRLSQVRMKWLAHHDTLTKLANRNVLELETAHALEGMRRMDHSVCLLFIDLDQLKPVNDRFGHMVGDKLLVSAGKLLTKHVRSSDIVARWGGDEFVILLRNCSLDEARLIANKIHHDSHGLSLAIKGRIKISFSIGVVKALADDTQESLIDRADKACYLAKKEGRDRVVVVD